MKRTNPVGHVALPSRGILQKLFLYMRVITMEIISIDL